MLASAGIALLFAAVLIVFVGGLPDRAIYSSVFLPGETRPIAPEINALAPPFVLPTLDDVPTALWDLRGQPVILNFWATWCAPCEIEMPELQTFYAQYGTQVRLLAINLGETAEIAQGWVERFDLTFDALLDVDGTVASLYRLRAQPSTFIITPDGIIAQAFFGPVTFAALRDAVAPFLSD